SSTSTLSDSYSAQFATADSPVASAQPAASAARAIPSRHALARWCLRAMPWAAHQAARHPRSHHPGQSQVAEVVAAAAAEVVVAVLEAEHPAAWAEAAAGRAGDCSAAVSDETPGARPVRLTV